MAKEYAMRFYKSRAWIQCREGYLRTQDYICERCGDPAKIVHHREYITPDNINDPSITLAWDNLEALCMDCHNKEHSEAPMVREGLRFDSNGDLICE